MGSGTNTTATKKPETEQAVSGTSENRFIQALNLSPAEQARYNASTSMMGHFMAAVGLGDPVENPHKVVSEIVAGKTPDQLLNALEASSPSYKTAFDTVRGDTQFKTAIHNAVSKDPTVLESFKTMIGTQGSAKPEELAGAFKDSQNRKVFGDILNVIAESPDLKGGDLIDAVDAGLGLAKDRTNKDKQQKWKDTLGKFNVHDGRMEMAALMNNPMELLGKFFNDPIGTAKMFFDTIKDQIPPQYHNMVMGGLGQLSSGLSAFLNPNGDWVGHYVRIGKMVGERTGSAWEKSGEAILNETTKKAGIDAGQGTAVPPGQGIDVKVNKSGSLNSGFSKAAQDDSFKASPEIKEKIDAFDKEQVATRTVPHASPGLATP
jgi:hypothetical protein